MGEGRGRIVDGNPIVISILIFFYREIARGQRMTKEVGKNLGRGKQKGVCGPQTGRGNNCRI